MGASCTGKDRDADDNFTNQFVDGALVTGRTTKITFTNWEAIQASDGFTTTQTPPLPPALHIYPLDSIIPKEK